MIEGGSQSRKPPIKSPPSPPQSPKNRRVSIQDLARAHGTSYVTISRILHSHLGLKGEWFLHWDNAPVHTAMVILEFLAKKRIKLLSHPPYSPDLTPADYILFPKLKKEKGRASP
jgi:hypothetical protein